MNNDSTRKRRVQKTLGLHYSRFYLIARCIDSLFRRKILENRSSAAPVEKVGLEALWPVLSGTALAIGLWFWGNRLPRIPEGDIVVGQEAAFRASYVFGAALERTDARLRQWPAAGLSRLVWGSFCQVRSQ